jgi:hypothetical protein
MHKKMLLNIASLVVGFSSFLMFFGVGGYCLLVMNWHGVMSILINSVIFMLMFTVSVYFIYLSDNIKKKI